jgi:DNA-binding NarL/FixJ family response regulator
MFQLSQSEAAVGLAMLGGAGAPQVAQLRGVSTETVRRQIRNLLEKTGASNLRDFERIVATLSLLPAAPG